jgi:uncharacterized protein YjbI with pentapeptide repeats
MSTPPTRRQRRSLKTRRNRSATTRPAWARRKPTPEPRRDWFTIGAIAAAGLPGLAALIALIPTYLSLRATDAQIQVAQQGQVTDQYNAAIANLGSKSIEVRLGGIYALQRLMQNTSSEQPTVVAVLCAFVRDETASIVVQRNLTAYRLPADVQAAITVVGTRNPANDGAATVLDFDHAQVLEAQLSSLQLSRGDFSYANLSSATIYSAGLGGANLSYADLTDASLNESNLTGANLLKANLGFTDLGGTNLRFANLGGANFTGALIAEANLTDADLSVANLTGANLTGANLSGANLFSANLGEAVLTDANLQKANVGLAEFRGAILTGAEWPSNAPPPAGWVRVSGTGRLRRANTAAAG